VIDDDKTTEIILPVSQPVQPEPHRQPPNWREAKRPLAHHSTAKTAGHSAAAAQSPSWLHILKEEIRSDWTLRILAALTILALSLLVL
jgi:hypothetical protein